MPLVEQPHTELLDHCVEVTLRKTCLGVAIALVPSVVILRTAFTRCAFVGLCAGLGSGIGFRESQYLLQKGVAFDRRVIVTFTPENGKRRI